jgi:hypothetical protein
MKGAAADEMLSRLAVAIPSEQERMFEQDIRVKKDPLSVIGIIDMLGGDCRVWEFKCVSVLTVEHYAQVVMYRHLLCNQTKCERSMPRVVNFRTG